MNRNLENRKVFDNKRLISRLLLLSAVFVTTIAISSQSAYAMPSYSFGAVDNNAVHIDMSSMSDTSNRDAIHIDISAMGEVQQNIPRNSERIGTLTIPSGKQIGVFGGESLQSMNKGAAHFSDTGLNFGNTALIGHNRGRSNGFFIFVKDLQVGQSLTLEANGTTKTYVVAEMYKIHATETDLLMHFGDSRLTLLTCWENERDYRRVVVAYEL